MCLFCKIKHSFTLSLSTVYLSLVQERFSFFYRNNEVQTFCYCVSLSCFVWIYNLTVTIVPQKYQELSLQVEISE